MILLLSLYYVKNTAMLMHHDPLIGEIFGFLKTYATPQAEAQDATGRWRHIRSLIPRAQGAFNTAATDRSHQQPAARLSKRYKLTNIAGTYRMPQGLSAPVIEAYCIANATLAFEGKLAQEDAHDNLRTVIDRLIDINPSLKNVRCAMNQYRACYDFALGITSGFNSDDIQFFIDGNFFQKSMDNPAYAAKFNAACTALGSDTLGWVPAPQTLDRIIAQKPRQP